MIIYIGNPRRQLAVATAVLFLLIPTAASANGAMSLALATFEWVPWLVYVAVTVLFEAAAMGKWSHVPLARAFICSLKANFFTALLGGLVSGLICALLGFYGGRLNPNPFGQTLILFTLFGCGSAFLEARTWVRAAARTARDGPVPSTGSKPANAWTITVRCIIVHLVGVPVGLAVLLAPAKPYPGLESQVYATRLYYLGEDKVSRALQQYIAAHQSLPQVHSYGALLQLLRPQLGDFGKDRDLWAGAYVPDFHRFDTTERKRHPIEWNSRATLTDSTGAYRTVWLVRSRWKGFCTGFELDGFDVKRTNDPKVLGYTR